MYIYIYLFLCVSKGNVFLYNASFRTCSPAQILEQRGCLLRPRWNQTREIGRAISGEWINMGVAENSVPLNPMVNDPYPY